MCAHTHKTTGTVILPRLRSLWKEPGESLGYLQTTFGEKKVARMRYTKMLSALMAPEGPGEALHRQKKW